MDNNEKNYIIAHREYTILNNHHSTLALLLLEIDIESESE